MKKIFPIAVLMLNCMGAGSQILVKLDGDSLATYSYQGGDEFNGTKLDENKWQNGLDWTRVLISQDVAFSPEKVKVEKGLLGLLANKEDSTYVVHPWEIDSVYFKSKKLRLHKNQFTTHYSVGCIITKEKYHYGIYQLRFKAEEGKGVWPAFWFFGGDRWEEIDAFELKGEKNNKIHVDVHCPTGCDNYKKTTLFRKNYGGWLKVSDYLHKGFNVMHLEWKPEEVIWYLNGFPLAYFKGRFDNPMKIYVNTSVAKDDGAFPPGPDESTRWPNVFIVDYLRIFEAYKNDNEIEVRDEFKRSGTATLFPNDDFTESDIYPATQTIKPLKKRGFMYNKKHFKSQQGMLSININSANSLTVVALGEVAEAGTINVETSAGSTRIESNKANVIQVPGTDRQIKIIIKNGKKSYSKTLSLGKKR
jgi:beta-glucanase (GH16 family)